MREERIEKRFSQNTLQNLRRKTTKYSRLLKQSFQSVLQRLMVRRERSFEQRRVRGSQSASPCKSKINSVDQTDAGKLDRSLDQGCCPESALKRRSASGIFTTDGYVECRHSDSMPLVIQSCTESLQTNVSRSLLSL